LAQNRWRPHVPGYRCYFLSSDDHIRAAENIMAETLNEAIERANAILELHPQHHAILAWVGPNKIFERGRPR
jgi:hypothetical protein